MAIDAKGRRLFVAELGNGSVEAIDLARGVSLGRIGGLRVPQGLAYLAGRDELAVASGGDGSVRFYRAADLTPAGVVRVGDDADNLRVDGDGRLVVGYGGGGLATIDPASRAVTARAALSAHPESFQFDPAAGAIYVNLPDAHAIGVVDVRSNRQVGAIGTDLAFANFPMALEPRAGRLAVVFRAPAQLRVYALRGRVLLAKLGVCGDATMSSSTTAGTASMSSAARVWSISVAPRGAGYGPRRAHPHGAGRADRALGPRGGRLYVAAPARGGGAAELLVLDPRP